MAGCRLHSSSASVDPGVTDHVWSIECEGFDERWQAVGKSSIRKSSGGSAEPPHPGASQATAVNGSESDSSSTRQRPLSQTAPCRRTSAGPLPCRCKAAERPAMSSLKERGRVKGLSQTFSVMVGVLGDRSGPLPPVCRRAPRTSPGSRWSARRRSRGRTTLTPARSGAGSRRKEGCRLVQAGSARR
jgi:hypothetical protein